MCHAPADCFNVKDRGYLNEGYFADMVLVDLEANELVSKPNIYYKCAWSPLEGTTFCGKVQTTFVNGNIVYSKGLFGAKGQGKRLNFKA